MPDQQQPDGRPPKEKATMKDRVETAQSVKEFFSKEDAENLRHCPKCYGNQKSEKYSKLATAFSLGAFAVAAVSLGMQLLAEPATAVRFNEKEWREFLGELQKIVPASSSSSSARTAVPASRPASAASTEKSSAAAVSSAASTSSAAAERSISPAEPADSGARAADGTL
jgi:hypothetical protein